MWDEKEPSPRHLHIRHKKPSWWPENEPWPPVGPPWRSMRGRFSRRLGCLLAVVNLIGLIVVAIVLGLSASFLGFIHIPAALAWIIPGGIVLFVLGISSLIWAARGIQRISTPLGDLMDAAGRIARGDYSPRVLERGPSDIKSLLHAFNGMAAKLQLTEEQRRDLMADITHELRTPLTVIQGNLEGILDGVYAPDESRIKSMLEETQILTRLVEDLRTLALAESGALQLKKEPTDLAGLIGETAAAFRTQADAAGVRLEIQTDLNGELLDLDPERIRQVLSNLVANALRYTPSAGVIRLSCQIDRVNSGKVALVGVSDTGPGISPELLPNIFNRFYKSRDSSGMGLGLPIARYLVEAHGGTITAESQAGKGTTIRFSLPVQTIAFFFFGKLPRQC